MRPEMRKISPSARSRRRGRGNKAGVAIAAIAVATSLGSARALPAFGRDGVDRWVVDTGASYDLIGLPELPSRLTGRG